MNKYLIIIVLAFITSNIFSQYDITKPTLEWGDEFTIAKHYSPITFFNQSSDGAYCLLDRPPKLFTGLAPLLLQKLDRNMNPIETEELVWGHHGSELFYEFLIEISGRTFFFLSFDDEDEEKILLFYKEFYPSSMKFSNKMEKLFEIDYGFNSFAFDGIFNYKLSPDSTKILIYTDTPVINENEFPYKCKMFDSNMTELWENDLLVPHYYEDVEFYNVLVDRQGNVSFLNKIYDYNDDELIKEDENYQYHFMFSSLLEKGKIAKNFVPNIKNKFLIQATSIVNNDDNVIFAGYYSEISDYLIKGIYYTRLDIINQKEITSSVSEFDIEFLTAILSKRKMRKAKKKKKKGDDIEILDYELNEIITDDVGNLYLAGERYVIRSYMREDINGYMRTNHQLYVMDVIISKLDENGKIIWNNRIAKRQKYPYANVLNIEFPYHVSYSFIPYGNDLYTFYMDDRDNYVPSVDIKITDADYVTNPKSAQLVMAVYDKDGNVQRTVLDKYLPDKLINQPCNAFQISENEMILFKVRKKRYKYGTLKFSSQ